jgi:GRAS domain family
MNPTKKYATLIAVVEEALAGREDVARRLLAHLVDHLDADQRPEDLQYYIFASALSRRLASERTAEINLYLRQFGSTQISLFNLLAEHLPTVSLAGPLANALLSRFVGGHEEVTLLDIGIGSGRQETALLYALAAEGRLPKRLNVIAIEPDAGSLIEAQTALWEASVELGFELDFLPVHKLVEELDDADWAYFAGYDSPLVVHAAFAAHHVRCTDASPVRDELFRRLRELDPDAVVLAEPNSNHHSSSLRERFLNAWNHFGLTFRLIDRLGVSREESAAMKMFFAREIDDIVANAEETRCERHENVETWVERLRRAGFTPYADTGFAREFAHDTVRVTAREGYVGLDYADETLVAVICATAGVPAALAAPAPAELELEAVA